MEMNRLSRKLSIIIIMVVVSAAVGAAIIFQTGRPKADVHSSGHPACSEIYGTSEVSPCAVLEDGEIFIKWDGVTFKSGLAPTPYPVPYREQSIHPDILMRAQSEGIVLDITDYEEAYVGIVHNHLPLECDGDLFCSEAWFHRMDFDRYSSNFNTTRVEIQKHGINYVEVDGVTYLDGLDQLYLPTPVQPTPTTVPTSTKR